MAVLTVLMFVLAILGQAAVGVFSLLSMLKKIHKFPHLLMLCGAGVMLLSSIFAMVGILLAAGSTGQIVMLVFAFIFTLLGWGGLATGFVFLSLGLWEDQAAAAQPAAPKAAAGAASAKGT